MRAFGGKLRKASDQLLAINDNHGGVGDSENSQRARTILVAPAVNRNNPLGRIVFDGTRLFAQLSDLILGDHLNPAFGFDKTSYGLTQKGSRFISKLDHLFRHSGSTELWQEDLGVVLLTWPHKAFAQTFGDQTSNSFAVHGIKINGMSIIMSTNTTVYDGAMATNRWDGAKCCSSQHLPWTDDYEPTERAIAEMSSICAECPLLMPCAQYALTDKAAGGFYAGVWLPWNMQRKTHHRRAARIQLRTKVLKKV